MRPRTPIAPPSELRPTSGGEAMAEEGVRERRTGPHVGETAFGFPVKPLGPADVDAPATRGDVADCAHAHGALVRLLDELVEVTSGEVIAVPRRLILNAGRPFDTFVVDAPDQFHSVKLDNPAAAALDVVFSGTQPTAANSDERVAAHMGRILTRPYGEVSIGFDPAVVPAGDTVIRCTFYSRAYPPTSYAFV